MFLIILKYHEKIQGEAVARPRCCLGPLRTKKSFQLEQETQPGVSLLSRERSKSIQCLSVGLRGSHQQCQGGVYVEAGVGGFGRDPSMTLPCKS